MIIIGSTIGGWVAGEKGARIGMIIGVLLALFAPWRRLRLWFRGGNSQDENGGGEV